MSGVSTRALTRHAPPSSSPQHDEPPRSLTSAFVARLDAQRRGRGRATGRGRAGPRAGYPPKVGPDRRRRERNTRGRDPWRVGERAVAGPAPPLHGGAHVLRQEHRDGVRERRERCHAHGPARGRGRGVDPQAAARGGEARGAKQPEKETRETRGAAPLRHVPRADESAKAFDRGVGERGGAGPRRGGARCVQDTAALGVRHPRRTTWRHDTARPGT